MPRSPRGRPGLTHPGVTNLDLLDVLHTLSDRTRMTIVQTLRHDAERACGAFPVEVAPSTLTHHFRVLREAGVIRQRNDGHRRLTTVRVDDLERRLPGLFGRIVAGYDRPVAPAWRSGVPLGMGWSTASRQGTASTAALVRPWSPPQSCTGSSVILWS